jgi:hypothetical protein
VAKPFIWLDRHVRRRRTREDQANQVTLRYVNSDQTLTGLRATGKPASRPPRGHGREAAAIENPKSKMEDQSDCALVDLASSVFLLESADAGAGAARPPRSKIQDARFKIR